MYVNGGITVKHRLLPELCPLLFRCRGFPVVSIIARDINLINLARVPARGDVPESSFPFHVSSRINWILDWNEKPKLETIMRIRSGITDVKKKNRYRKSLNIFVEQKTKKRKKEKEMTKNEILWRRCVSASDAFFRQSLISLKSRQWQIEILQRGH